MALDGIAVAAIVNEIKATALGGRIDKIYQPEHDEITIAIRSLGVNCKLLLSANASNPRVHFTKQSKSNPMQAPMFCMILRKHLAGGKITGVYQPDFERIIKINIDSMNEMGDVSTKSLIIEIMGKHSNIMLVNDNGIIIDSIKRITHETSSVREVLPGYSYLSPDSKGKIDPLKLDKNIFMQTVRRMNTKLQNCIYQSYNGISPIVASEICHRACCDPGEHIAQVSDSMLESIFFEFESIMRKTASNDFNFETYVDVTGKPVDFAPIKLTLFDNMENIGFNSCSEMLEFYYGERDSVYRAGQKTADLKKTVSILLERCIKKKEIQLKTLNDIKDRDTMRIYGDLITANIYSIQKGMTSFSALNYYDESVTDGDYPEISVPLDADLTPAENAQRYFKRYNKEKRTFVALAEQIKSNDDEIEYFEGIMNALQNAREECVIDEIKEELANEGFLKRKRQIKSKQASKSKPMHFISTDGFHIFVGKNNTQNDELTLRTASANDLWLHTKNIPGSHVIIKADANDIPDTTITEAAHLAAYYSKAKNSSMVPVDFTRKKNVKKPNGAKPGMVTYETNRTAYITPDEAVINTIKEVPV